MKNSPLVSVIIPTYNRGYIIDRAIRSILNQTYQNFEIIIVDDGNDNTEKMVRKFKDDRIRYFHRNKKYGIPSARNFGIKKSKGKYIAFLDSDDEWLSFKLEEELKMLENNPSNIAFISSNYIVYFKNVKFLCKTFKTKEEALKRKIFEVTKFPILQATLFKREIFQKIGLFDEHLRIYEDFDIFMRIVNSPYDFLIIDKPTAIMHIKNVDNITRSKKTPFIEDLNYLVEKHKKFFTLYPKVLSSLYECIGLLLISIGNLKEGIMCLLSAVKSDKKIIFNIIFDAWKSFARGKIISLLNKLF